MSRENTFELVSFWFSVKLICYLILATVLISENYAVAQQVTCVDISGNLDSSSESSVPPADTTIPFDELGDAANFSTNFTIIDSLGSSHVLSVFFFRVGSSAWKAQLYQPLSEVSGGGADIAVLVGGADLIFNESGMRSEDVEEDIRVIPTWNNGSNPRLVILRLPSITQLEQASNILEINTDCTEDLTPVPGDFDFDRDGTDDLIIFRPELGRWFVRQSGSTGIVFQKQWGLSGDVPLIGDYDGDGAPELVVWRPSSANWYICRSSDFYDCSKGQVVQFGLPDDIPQAGDFDGDKRYDPAIWRPSDLSYYYFSSMTNLVVKTQWGLPGDITVTGAKSKP